MSLLWRPLAPGDWIELQQIGEFSVRLDHRIRACRMMAYGTYEWQELRHLRRLIRPGDTVFDVGANVGYVAACLADAVGATGQVHLFEPAPQCRPFLQHLIESDPAGVIRANWCAVADRSGCGSFFETEHTLSHGYARLDRRPSNRFVEVTQTEVRVTALDDYIAEHEIARIDLIKIDVEGHELPVLRGLQRTFDRGQRPMLFLEVSRGEEHDQENRAICDLLTDRGYSAHLMQRELVQVRWTDLPARFHGNLLWLNSQAP